MCHFVSWIEKNGKLWFLTTKDIQSKKGKELRDWCQDDDDLKGHGAIRYFYGIEGGVDRECSDFSTPANFPHEIAKAIVSGKFKRFFSPTPNGILRAPLYADYEAKRAPLYADYKAKRDALYADYEAKRDALDELEWLQLAKCSERRTDAWRL